MMAELNAEQFTETFSFFRNSPRQLVEDILSSSRHAFAHLGTLMHLEGEPCTYLELVLSGEERGYKSGPAAKEITLYEVGPGEACPINAVCVLTDTAFPLNVAAITDVSLLLIPAKDFKNLLSEYEEMRTFVFRSVGQRFEAVLGLVDELVFKKMDQRLFDYIVEKSEDGRLPTTHQQIANDLGTAREVVSRLLRSFERDGRVALSRGHIRLLGPYHHD
ncbi:MAG: Crp/Fnr family transcriptional regulator [Planctomycetota bacterium]|jgi:CRP/FNR family transcriptional regulator